MHPFLPAATLAFRAVTLRALIIGPDEGLNN